MKIETEKIWKKRALKLLEINFDKHVLEICCKERRKLSTLIQMSKLISFRKQKI